MKTFYLLFIASIFVLLSCKPKESNNIHTHEGAIYYTCSMDPQIIQDKPGKCPICHMELTPVAAGTLHSNGISLSEQQILLGNIKTQSTDSENVQQGIYATGLVKTDEATIQWINTRMDGRIDRLMYKTTGAIVQKGQVLYMIYSEPLAALQNEYIQNSIQLKREPSNAVLHSIQNGIEEKLLLWGITKSQIAALTTYSSAPIPYPITSQTAGYVSAVSISEGTSVMEGQNILQLADYNSLWIDAQVYSEDMTFIQNGHTVAVSVEGISTPINGRIIQTISQVAPSSAIHIVRISIDNLTGTMQPGMQATVRFLKKQSARTIIIPSDAVIQSPAGAIVWVKTTEGIFESRMVETGTVGAKVIAILNGLKEGDDPVISGAYLLQSEFVFKKGMNPMAGHEM